MTADRTAAITSLLSQAEAAHGLFEATELNGVYDQEWPRWYAEFAVDHGIAGLVRRPLTADRLAEFFTTTFAEFRAADPRPADLWATYTARRIAAEL